MGPSLSEIKRLPKADLHSHIDGSVSLGELFRIAEAHRRSIRAPSGAVLESKTAFYRYVRGRGLDSLLEDIVNRFYPITGIMQTEAIIRDVGVAYVKAQKTAGVAYAEGRFAPQYHTREGLSLADVIRSMSEGIAEGSERFGVRTNLIVAFGRESEPRLAEAVAKAASTSKSAVAFDIGGPEAGNPAEKFERAFSIAGSRGLKKVAHAGEGAGSLKANFHNMDYAMSGLGVSRLGHAIDISRSEELVGRALERDVTVEMNPVSNLALKKIDSVSHLGIDKLLMRGLRVTVNSDDPALWPRGDLAEAMFAVCVGYGFRSAEIDRLVLNSFEGSFASQDVKRELADGLAAARRRAH